MLALPDKIRASRRLTQPQNIASPILGWNTRDPFEEMQPQDAIRLDNWYPDFGGVRVRNGSTTFAYQLGPEPVETLAVLQTASINRFLAACSGSIFDISLGGAITSSPLATAFTSNRWQTAVFQSHLFLVNGQDAGQIYDGTTLSAMVFTGVATATLAGVQVIHNRLFFWTGIDPSFWYGTVNSITGALVNFDLSTVSQNAGNLLSVEVLTYDGGQGIDSYTCFFMTSGEVLLYQGTDPSNANNWALVGRYLIPPPIGIRGITRYGGDVYIATQTDHFQLSVLLIALKLGEVPPRTKISGAATDAFNAGGTLFGWQAIYYPRGTRIIFNIPNADGSFAQHIYNTSLKAWSRFKGMNASCWAVYKDKLYFGKAGGEVVQADIGSVDKTVTGGIIPINAPSQQAWQTFGTPLKKRLAASRIVVQTNNNGASYKFRVGLDYNAFSISTPVALPPSGTLWGSVNWGEFFWAGQAIVDTDWHIETGEGSAFSWGVMARSQAPLLWVRTDLLLEPGSAL